MVGSMGAALGAFGVYYATGAPGLTFIDSGELAAVCYLPGIAHPTGYPLYTIMGWLIIQLFTPRTPIVLLNTLSAIFSSFSLLVFSRAVMHLFNNDIAKDRLQPTDLAATCSVAGSTMLLACSAVFWSVSLVTEVYALHALFITLFIFLSLQACGAKNQPENGKKPAAFRWVALLFLTVGISFSHHMSTILFIPALIYLLIVQKTWQTLAIKQLLLLPLCLLCGLSFYLYLPLRAANFPMLNWGNPQTWEAFIWHVTGKQYRVWMFSSPAAALQQLEYFLTLVIKAFGVVPLLLVPFGLWHLFHRNRRMLWFTLILAATDLLYAVNYDIQDVDPYFLPVFVVMALWMGSAMLFFASKALYKWKSLYYIVLGSLCSLFLFPLLLNFNEVNQSKNRLVEQYSRTILNTLEPNALIFSYQWDYFCSACYYLQVVEGIRPDVIMIEVQLLKRSWYITQLQKNYEAFLQQSQDEVTAYAQELYKFEHGLPYDPHLIQQRYLAMINSFIQRNIDTRPIY